MNIIEYFRGLYKSNKELVLLQWVYLLLSGVSVLICGIFALINQQIGVAMLIVPLVAFVALSMNIVAWALIKLVADTFVKTKKPVARAKKKA